MASCSANGSNGHHKITLNVSQQSQNITNNKSTVSFSVVLSPVQNGYDWIFQNSDPFTCTYTINGTSRTCTLRRYDGTSTVTLASGTQDVSHNSDGTKSISFSFSVTSQSYTYLIGSCSASGSLTLTTIARASTFTAGNGTLGTAQTISVTRQSTSFTHTLTYKVGSTSGTIGSAKTTTTSISWTPPASLGAQNTTGTSLSCTLTLTTYNGSSTVGSNSKTITLTIPSGNPSFTLSVSDTKGYASTYGGYVNSKSTLKAALSSVSCTYSASVKSYSIAFKKTNSSGANLATATTTSLSWTPNWAGTVYITATVTDSRGRSTTKTSSVTTLAYSAPSISTLTVGRYSDSGGTTKDDGGAYAKITYAGSYTSLSGHNTAKITIKYKKSSASSWTTAVNASTTLSGTTSTFAADIASTYDVRAEITDNFNTTAIIRNTVISVGSAFMHWRSNGNGLAFGKMSENNNCLEVGWPYILMKRSGQPTFWMYRTDRDTQAAFYLWDDADPAVQFMFKQSGDESWTYGPFIGRYWIRPRTTNTHDVGSTTLQWKGIYGKTIYENGTSLESKYAPIVSVALNNDSLGWSNGNTVASGSWVTVGSYNFPVGRYLVMTRVEFAQNATGIRQMMWTTSNTGTSAWTQQSYSTSPGISGWTNLQSVFYANITTAGSRYLRVYQSSGSALGTYVYVQIIGV